MNHNRRDWLNGSLAGLMLGLARPARALPVAAEPFSVIVLGDLHYDKLSHHDFEWLAKNKPDDLSQIQNYSKLTKETMPRLFALLRERILLQAQQAAPVAFVLQVGDLVEGLCGNAELATLQNREVIEFIRSFDLGVPFLATKGNHDVTGDGAQEAFDEVFLPFLQKESREVDPQATMIGANYSLTYRDHQFLFYDAYDRESLDWFEAIIARRTASRLLVTIHPPVVPYGARATWHLFSETKSQSQREHLLQLLGDEEAIVLGGHLHKFAAVKRRTRTGQFTQLAVSSVVSSFVDAPRDVLRGVDQYTSHQVTLEPQHSPNTISQRRALYEEERQWVTMFEYANTAGFAVLTIDPNRIMASVQAGAQSLPFRQLTLTNL